MVYSPFYGLFVARFVSWFGMVYGMFKGCFRGCLDYKTGSWHTQRMFEELFGLKIWFMAVKELFGLFKNGL